MKHMKHPPRHYTRLRKHTYGSRHQLVPLREQDIFLIKDWRNAQINVLRQKRPLTDEDQRRYFSEVVLPSFGRSEPQIMLFSYLKEHRCIGYGGLVHIDWESKRAEVSFLLEPERAKDISLYTTEFTAFLELIRQIAFEELGLNRLFTETYDIRPSHIRVLETNGFVLEGRIREHVYVSGRFVDSLIHGCLRNRKG